MKTAFRILLLFIGILPLNAQKNVLEILKKDPNITWISETMTDYTFQKESNYWEDKEWKILNLKGKNELNLLKYSIEQNPKSFPGEATAWSNVGHYLSIKLIELANSNAGIFYKDSTCYHRLSNYEARFLVQDSIEILTPDAELGHQTSYQVNDLPFEDIVAFRVYQYLAYHEKEARFRSHPIALAPIILDRETQKPHPIFWIPLNRQKKLSILKTKKITWALGVRRDIEFKNTKVLKGNTNYHEVLQNMLNKIYNEELEIAKKAFYKENTKNSFLLKKLFVPMLLIQKPLKKSKKKKLI